MAEIKLVREDIKLIPNADLKVSEEKSQIHCKINQKINHHCPSIQNQKKYRSPYEDVIDSLNSFWDPKKKSKNCRNSSFDQKKDCKIAESSLAINHDHLDVTQYNQSSADLHKNCECNYSKNDYDMINTYKSFVTKSNLDWMHKNKYIWTKKNQRILDKSKLKIKSLKPFKSHMDKESNCVNREPQIKGNW